MSSSSAGLFNFSLRRFLDAWPLGRAPSGLADALSPELPDADLAKLKTQIDACLEARGGEVSARAMAAELGQAYLALNVEGRRRFLEVLVRDYDVDQKTVDAAIEARHSAANESGRRRAEGRLRDALVSPRVKLMSQFTELPQGVKFLVELRAELLELIADNPELEALDHDLLGLLASWFNVGFLELRRITWDTPASLLEKLIGYEAVHAIQSWENLKHRLEKDRRCYAYFHPCMPDELLIFVQVALVNGIAENVQALLDERAEPQDPKQADTAIFYSISNCQKGLTGVSFGDFLIKRVVEHLQGNRANLKVFATLSPIPGFCSWLNAKLADEAQAILSAPEAEQLCILAQSSSPNEPLTTLLKRPHWHEDGATAAVLEPILMRLCARYLLEGRRGDRAEDPVAHFHLTNGARIERLNWLADRSPRGLEQSAGLMVNYRYELKDIEHNHELYAAKGKVSAAASVKKLAKG